MVCLFQQEDISNAQIILRAAIEIIRTHEVMEIATTSVAGAFAIGWAGFKLGVIHQGKVDGSAMAQSEAENSELRKENVWLRTRLAEVTTVVVGIFSVPVRNTETPSHIQEASPQRTLAEINAALPPRGSRWRRRRDGR